MCLKSFIYNEKKFFTDDLFIQRYVPHWNCIFSFNSNNYSYILKRREFLLCPSDIHTLNFSFRWEQLYGGPWRLYDEMLLTLPNLLRSLS